MENRNRRYPPGTAARRTAGVLAAVVLAALMVLMAFELVFTGFLPVKYLAAVIVLMAVIFVIAALLMIRSVRKGPFIAGLVLTILACIVLALSFAYVHRARTAVKTITTPNVETTVVSAYMRASDTRDFAGAASGLRYGIISDRDRANTDQAVADLTREFGFSPELKEYNGLPRLIDGILSEEVDAIIVNRGYIAILDEIEGYEDAPSRLREVWTARIEEPVRPSDQAHAPSAPTYESHEAAQYADGGEKITSDDGDTIAVYIGGIDSRSGLVEASRNDVNIIAVINTRTRQIALVSTPRDYYVPLSISGGARDKLTHAGIYGVQVSMDTLSMLYGIDIDYYFRLNFGGFVNIIDALGGVTVNSDYAFSADGYSFSEGENYLGGEAALAFVRERHAFASGDRQRGRNQMAVIRAVIKKMMSPELLTSFFDLMGALEGSFETSVPYDVLSGLVRDQLDSGGDWNVVSYSVDGEGDLQIPYSMSQYAYVMIPYDSTVSQARELFRQVYSGATASLS